MSTPTDVVVLIDLSNLILPLRDVIATRTHSYGESINARVHLDNAYRYAYAGRPVRRAVVAAARRPTVDALLPHLERLEPAVELLLSEPDPETNREVTVDSDLIAVIEELAEQPPATLALVTGDGAGHRSGRGFLTALQRLTARGWAVELLAWGRAMHAEMRRYVDGHPRGLVLPLDDVLTAITFIEGGRGASRLDQSTRPRISPGAPRRFSTDAGEIAGTLAAMARDGLLVAGSPRPDGTPTYLIDATTAAALIERSGRAE
jgi:hypothetical protein